MVLKPIAFLILLLFAKFLPAQTCTNAGQTPSSAILLCGSDFYVQGTVPICGQSPVPNTCPASIVYQNTNPTWFRLNCFSSGTLGFQILPNEADDNFDWQLFDVSGRNDDDVLTDPSLFVACNWCPDGGTTGASIDGRQLKVCAEASGELFSSMPNITQGHEYLLLVSHRNITQSGFQIVITGGSASVTDPMEPGIINARLSCNSDQVSVFLNKEMNCSTIAADGSDFIFSGAATITSANFSCISNRTVMIILNLSNAVPPGTYSIKIKTGNDGNTIVDRCGRQIAVGDSLVLPLRSNRPPTMDSLNISKCKPNTLRLVFKEAIQCYSIALDGSDFMITGPQPVTITSIGLSCVAQITTTPYVVLGLSSPIVTGGTYQIALRTGSDGNTLLGECGEQALPSTITFTVQPSVSAAFTYTIKPSCKQDTVYFSNNSPNAVSWDWKFDNISGTNSPNQVKIFPASGNHSIELTVMGVACKDTSTQRLTLDNKVMAAFEIPSTFCPEDEIKLVNNSTGTVDQWKWELGGGLTSILRTPPPFHYPITTRDASYVVKLTATNNSMNCKDSVSKRIQVLSNCYIAVPTAFTPNGDGLNDFLNPNNALKADNLLFRVFNRFGQVVFETKDWTRKWDGRINGQLQQTGVYAWTLTYTHRDTGEKVFQKGTTVLIR